MPAISGTKQDLYNLTEVANAMGVSYTAVSAWCRKFGIDTINKPQARGGHPLRFLNASQVKQLSTALKAYRAEVATSTTTETTVTTPTGRKIPVTITIGKDDPIIIQSTTTEKNIPNILTVLRQTDS